jgi:hypothetical protein
VYMPRGFTPTCRPRGWTLKSAPCSPRLRRMPGARRIERRNRRNISWHDSGWHHARFGGAASVVVAVHFEGTVASLSSARLGKSKRLSLFGNTHETDKFFPLEIQMRGTIDDKHPIVIPQRGLDRDY